MKRLLFVYIMCSIGGAAFAQNLDAVTITDQFNVGTRGKDNNAGPNFGNCLPDGSDFLAYTGPDFTASITTSGLYTNAWAAGAPESPVVTVTSPMPNPDRSGETIPSIPANTRPGASGASTAVLVGDDGGFNAIFFGESDDKDYYIQSDIYCWNKAGSGASEYEVAGIVARAARDNDTSMTDFSFNPDRAGSYGLIYDYQLQEVKAVRWVTGNTSGDIQSRVPTTYQQFGTTISNVTEGWHTMKIECKDAKIQFTFDGTVIATPEDHTVKFGRPGIYYRESGVADATERQGIFDQLKAGPATLVSGVASWNLY